MAGETDVEIEGDEYGGLVAFAAKRAVVDVATASAVVAAARESERLRAAAAAAGTATGVPSAAAAGVEERPGEEISPEEKLPRAISGEPRGRPVRETPERVGRDEAAGDGALWNALDRASAGIERNLRRWDALLDEADRRTAGTART